MKELNFDLKQLRSFLVVVEHRSFTRASRVSRVGQATISNHVFRARRDRSALSSYGRSSRDFASRLREKSSRSLLRRHFETVETAEKGNFGRGRGGGNGRRFRAPSLRPMSFPRRSPRWCAPIRSYITGWRFRTAARSSRCSRKVSPKSGDGRRACAIPSLNSSAYIRTKWSSSAPAGAYPMRWYSRMSKKLPNGLPRKGQRQQGTPGKGRSSIATCHRPISRLYGMHHLGGRARGRRCRSGAWVSSPVRRPRGDAFRKAENRHDQGLYHPT